jgi:hypothetical protein
MSWLNAELRRLATVGVSVAIASGITLSVGVFMIVRFGVYEPSSAWTLAVNNLFTSLLLSIPVLTLRSGVWANSTELVLRGLFLDVRFPTQTIRLVDVGSGLEVHVFGGRSYGSFGFGGSVMGAFAGYPSANRAANSINGWMHDNPPDDWDRRLPTRHLRPDLVPAAFVELIVFVLHYAFR